MFYNCTNMYFFKAFLKEYIKDYNLTLTKNGYRLEIENICYIKENIKEYNVFKILLFLCIKFNIDIKELYVFSKDF